MLCEPDSSAKLRVAVLSSSLSLVDEEVERDTIPLLLLPFVSYISLLIVR